MRCRIVRPGRSSNKELESFALSFLKLCSRHLDVEVVDTKTARGADPVLETREIQRHIINPAHIIAFDSRGENLNSRDFSRIICRALEGRHLLHLVIGGPSGLTQEFLSRSQAVVAFGQMTINHDLAFALLSEQLWRAMAIKTGHPYHKDH